MTCSRPLCRLGLWGLLCFAPSVLAASPSARLLPAPQADEPATTGGAAPGPTATGGTTPGPTPDEMDAMVARRRARLLLHQGFGFATEALHLGAAVVSFLDDKDRFGGGSATGNYKTLDVGMTSAVTLFTLTTFTLAATAPEPYERPSGGLDTTLLHKIFMFSAAGVNLAKLVFAALLYNAAGAQDNQTLVTLHRATLYAGPALFILGTAIQVF